MENVKELGVFKINPKEHKLIPTDFDWNGRQLWLCQIQCCDYYEIGSSNYSYDQIGKYNLVFYINAGDYRLSQKGGEEYVFVLQIEIAEWYRPEADIAKKLREILSKYPILNLEMGVLSAFRQRRYYMKLYKIEENG